MKTTHTTPSGKIVTLETFTVGQAFGTSCEVRARNGRQIATLETPRPYGFHDAAIEAGRNLADRLYPRKIEFRAYDTITEWSGPVRADRDKAQKDADRHNDGCARHGGYGSAIVVRQDPEAAGRIIDLEGNSVWPPHGRSTGAARWM